MASTLTEWHSYGNILQFTVLESSPTAVRWLLEAGSRPNDVCGGENGSPLQAAAYRGKEEVVRLLMEYGADVNPVHSSGKYGNPLQAAIFKKDEAIIQLLLDHGASVNQTGGRMGTPLQAAAKQGLESVVRMLIHKGANVNAPVGGEYGTALRAALANNYEEIARFLLQCGADMRCYGEFNHTTTEKPVVYENYHSALEVAAATNNPALVQLLLDNALGINEDGQACTLALHRASEMRDCTMLDFLIGKGADVRQYGGKALTSNCCTGTVRLERTKLLLRHGADVNGGPEATKSPLAASIEVRDWELMELLLNSGCDVNARYPGYHGSALHEAIDLRAVLVVKELINRGADVNLRAGSWGTPLAEAIMNGDEQLFNILLEHGAEIDPSPPYGYWGTPLQVAISKDYYNIAHTLLDRGANPHVPGLHQSPLIGACGYGKAGQLELIERLICAGADLEAEDVKRPEDDIFPGGVHLWTPLQVAAYTNNVKVVEVLLKRGARINPVHPQGDFGYPLQAAVKNGHVSMTKLLLENGADVNAVGGKFATALQAAAEQGSDELVNILLDSGADVSLEGGYYGSPLQASSRLGKNRHVELFLDRGAPINTNVGKYGNPLAAASKRAAQSTVEVLIRRGANVNQLGGKYGTPLQAACCASGSTAKEEAGSVIRMLIEYGADVNASGMGKYGMALQAAAYHDPKYVDILLSHGADPNVPGGRYGSAVEAARKKGYLRVEKQLLEHISAKS